MAKSHSAYKAELLEGVAKLLTNEKYCDLTIKCGGREWPVHKAIVCSFSDVLEREIDSCMREGITSVVEHTEFDADTVDRFIAYLYTGTYKVDTPDASQTGADTAKLPAQQVSTLSEDSDVHMNSVKPHTPTSPRSRTTTTSQHLGRKPYPVSRRKSAVSFILGTSQRSSRSCTNIQVLAMP